MSERIGQSATKRVVFRAFLASDHVTPATGKTIAITISKNGGAFANPAAGATNATAIASGFYYFDLGTGDTDTLGPLAYRGAEGTIDDVGDVFTVTVLGTAQTGDTYALANGATGFAAIDTVVDAILVDTAFMQPRVEALTPIAGTIGATGNTTTTLHLTGLPYGNDELNDLLIVVRDVSASEWHFRWITDWVASTAVATLHSALPFTPENSTDTYWIPAKRGDTPSELDLGVIVDAIWNAVLSSYTSAGSTGKALADIETDAAAILADTDVIGATGAGLTSLATAAALTTVDNEIAVIGGIVDSILLDTGTNGVVVAAASKSDYRLSATGVDDILDEAYEGTTTLRQYLRLSASALWGKLSGAATTSVAIRDEADTKNRIAATVDADGNRSAVTLDKS